MCEVVNICARMGCSNLVSVPILHTMAPNQWKSLHKRPLVNASPYLKGPLAFRFLFFISVGLELSDTKVSEP